MMQPIGLQNKALSSRLTSLDTVNSGQLKRFGLAQSPTRSLAASPVNSMPVMDSIVQLFGQLLQQVFTGGKASQTAQSITLNGQSVDNTEPFFGLAFDLASETDLSEPVVTSQSVDTEPVVITQPVDTEPVVIAQPVDTEPVVTTQPVDTEPVVITQPVDTEPVVITQPVDTEPVVITQPVVDTDPIFVPQPVVDTDPIFVPQPVVDTDPIFVPQPVVDTDPIFVPQPVVDIDPVVIKGPTTPEAIEIVAGAGNSESIEIYKAVLEQPESFSSDDIKSIKNYAAVEIAEHGHITGETLERETVNQLAAKGEISSTEQAELHEAIDERVDDLKESVALNGLTAEQPSGQPAPSIQDIPFGANGMSINERREMNYSNLKADPNGGDGYDNVRAGKKAFNGLSGQDAAILHLGGRAHISAGTSANGVSGSARLYNNVLNNPGNFTPDEVKLIQGYAAAETKKYGYFTGEGLDHDFAEQMAARGDISQEKLAEYHQAIDERVAKMVNNPNQSAVKREASQEVNITSDIGTLETQAGLSRYEQAVYRLAGHATLFSGDGSIDGDILAITLGNENSLDGRKFGNQDTNIDAETLSLLQDDLAIDGKLNGDALRIANEGVLDKIFMGGPDVTAAGIRKTSVQQAEKNGRSQQDVMQSLQLSANDAIKKFGGFVKEHPVMTAVGAGALAAGGAVCPYLAGTMAVGAGIAAGSKMFSEEAKPAASLDQQSPLSPKAVEAKPAASLEKQPSFYSKTAEAKPAASPKKQSPILSEIVKVMQLLVQIMSIFAGSKMFSEEAKQAA